jgi:RNA polymerase sigma-70 factor
MRGPWYGRVVSDPVDSSTAWARGHARWQFVVSRDLFEQAIATSQCADGADLDAEEVYLAAGCHLGLPEAIQIFEREYIARIPPTLRRQGFAADRIDEAMQRVRADLLLARDGEPMIRLCRYAGSGRLASLVRVSATRYARRVGAVGPAFDEHAEFWAADPQSDRLVDELGQRFKDAFAIALGRCAPNEKILLRMVFVENLTYREVAKLFGTSKSTVCRQLAEIEGRLVKHLTSLWREQTSASLGDDLGEIIAGRLDLSMSRLLREK